METQERNKISDVINKELKAFLVDRNAFKSFIENIEIEMANKATHLSPDGYLIYVDCLVEVLILGSPEVIKKAFPWKRTEGKGEGETYWEKMSDEWFINFDMPGYEAKLLRSGIDTLDKLSDEDRSLVAEMLFTPNTILRRLRMKYYIID